MLQLWPMERGAIRLLGRLLAAGAALGACAPQASGPEPLEGKLSSNGLVINHAALSHLSTLALATTQGDDLLLDESHFGTLLGAPGGEPLIEFIARCALGDGEALVVPSTGARYEGKLGLAPEWIDGACDESCQRWVSACLLAHANAVGASVTISPRGHHEGLYWSEKIEETFAFQEAAFYGNLFKPVDERVMAACAGDGLVVDFEAREEAGLQELGAHLSGRICGVGACGFTFAGPCQGEVLSYEFNACASFEDSCFEDCESKPLMNDPLAPAASPVFAEVITVYTLTE